MLLLFIFHYYSIILTSNKGHNKCSDPIIEQRITIAILDCLLHRVKIININEGRYRMKNRTKVFNKDIF
ncbi:ATP-binding protein [Guptibacillus hwajinpoensis]|uniref:ATP-binding protein n=1 Tax=Guptibacillus hwajinpoensis TaxID=208199 RepID=UPI0027D7EEEF|nr:ATP-binding protein [Alkalihalobacillus hemicentroti]